MPRVYRVKLWEDSGIPAELRRYCAEHDMSINAFANRAIAEKLQRMDVHSMTIEEIEVIERGRNDE